VDAIRHQLFAFPAGQSQEIKDRSWVYPGYSGSSSNRATLYQVLQNADSLLFRQDHTAERSCMWLRERHIADLTAVSLQSVAVLPKLLSWLIAGLAVHLASPIKQRTTITPSKHCRENSASQAQNCLLYSGSEVDVQSLPEPEIEP